MGIAQRPAVLQPDYSAQGRLFSEFSGAIPIPEYQQDGSRHC
jgi:hypothetical protein